MASRWILRKGGKGKGFRYETEEGRAVRDRATLDRIARLRVPPAWTDVHVAASRTAAVQAWGMDARGRKQYRYHDRAVEKGQLRKFYRVRLLARELPAIRRRLLRDMRARELGRDTVCAAVVRLIGEGFFRVGSERYLKENKTFGLSTLRKSHVDVDGDCTTFAYRGKGGIWQRQTVVDAELAKFVARMLGTPGPRLFRWADGEGGWHDLDRGDVSRYLHDRLDLPYSPKDFRTWGGTLRCATVLAELGPARTPTEAKRNVNTALRLVAAELGNTPTICRKSYVHPIVLARYLDDGVTIEPTRRTRRSRSVAEHEPEERALIAFLDEYFPERRSKPRERLAS